MASSDQQPELTGVLSHNIETLVRLRNEQNAERTREQRTADAVTRFMGSMKSVWLHLGAFGGWLLCNSGLIPGIKAWDPFPFVMLAMFASVEAIFLTTFVLISQNRQAEQADRRADLDLHISLLTEHEVTRLIALVDEIAKRFDVQAGRDAHLEELKQDVAPERVLHELERATESSD